VSSEFEDLQRCAGEERARARGFVDQLDPSELDATQRKLRRQILHQLDTAGLTALDDINNTGVAAIYDSTRRALALVDQIERGALTCQQKAVLSSAVAALPAAEDAAGAATRMA